MVSSPLRSKSACHARSVSLPSRPYPLIPQVNDHLSLVGDGLSSLEDMYDCLDDWLLLSHTQQVIAQQRHEKWVEEVLDGYLRLLDVCTATKDVSSQTKQDVQGLLSVLRRRRETNDFSGYLASRKKAKKAIQKSLKDLKGIKSKGLASDKDCKNLEIVGLLNEVEAATIGVFESLLSYVAGTKVQSRLGGFSLISKLMHHKSVASQDEESTNDFEKFDGALQSLIGCRTSKTDSATHVENFQNQLGKMEMSIQELEEGLECLFRRLIKTRVSLLNILNH
ncbi:hypothetical protein CsSME_00025709 [Camellia sinensis var. sinensis]